MRGRAMKNRNFSHRLGSAWAGIRSAWREERSLRTHLLATGLLLAVLIALRPAPIWRAIPVLAAALVIAAELVTTALEHMADHLLPEQLPLCKIVIVCAAGAVLGRCIAALCWGTLMVCSVF